jgi:diguanylate cyclase (GGDEF)-like protein
MAGWRALRLATLLLCGLLSATAAVASEPLQGSPPVVRHALEASFEPSNFGIVQDLGGIVHLANANGVLSYDGERWTLIPLSNHEMVRSLAVAEDGRVYVGGYGAFGYLRHDAGGEAAFVDLAPKYSALLEGRELADIWDVVVSEDAVWFRAVRDVFRWNPRTDEIAHWHHPGRFGAITVHEGQTLLQFRGVGLHRLQRDRWELLPETAELTELVFALLPLADGGLLTLGVDGRWWRWQDGELRAQAMPAGLPPSSQFEHSLRLSDGSLALAGADGSVYLVDRPLLRWRRLAVASDFLSGIVAARGGGFLVTADDAFFHISWPSQWTVTGAEDGVRGSLFDLVRWNGVDYLLSSSGLARLDPAASGLDRVRPLALPLTAVLALQPLGDGRALVAENHRLSLLEAAELRPLFDDAIYAREFLPSQFEPGRIYVGTELGLRVLQPAAAGYAISPPAEMGGEVRVVGLVERAPGELWFGSVRHGLWQVRLDERGTIVEQRSYTPDDAPLQGNQAAARIALLSDGVLRVSLPMGLYRVEGERLVADDLHGLAALRPTGSLLQLVETDDGALWAYGSAGVYRRAPAQDWVEQPVQQLRRGAFVGHRLEPGGGITLIGSRGLLSFDPSVPNDQAQAAQLQLRSVTRIHPDGRREALPLAPQITPELPAGDYAISFQYALPEFSAVHAAQYQGRLLGYGEPWSEWSRSRGFAYSRLRPGEYALELQARDASGRLSRTEPWAFRIEPPWYASWWARALAGLLLVLLVLLGVSWIVRRRLRRLENDRRQLADLVSARTRELAGANQRLQQMAHQDGLTGIANRRRLDDFLVDAWQQAREESQPLALLAIDVDHFKRYNDSHGHLAGDELLKTLARLLGKGLHRERDLLARFGGEEFLVVLPATGIAEALRVAERLREQVSSSALGATISIGVASQVPTGDAPSTLIAAADRALYAAKAAGRNRVEGA